MPEVIRIIHIRIMRGISMNDLIANINKLHTTKLGIERVKKNLALDTEHIVAWCKQCVVSPQCSIIRKGKNWYANIDGCTITINAHSYTIITAHKTK